MEHLTQTQTRQASAPPAAAEMISFSSKSELVSGYINLLALFRQNNLSVPGEAPGEDEELPGDAS